MKLAFGLEDIYEDAEFQIGDLDKVGIVGVNGAGKTTLFRLLLQEISLDRGSISMGNARLGYLPQEIVLEDENITVMEFIASGRPIKKFEDEISELYTKLSEVSEEEHKPIYKRISYLQDRLEYFDYYEAENILYALVDSMKIDLNLMDRPLKELSGGQKSKIAFAKVLYSKPEILLLDEPTNHLDNTTKDFVVKYLKGYRGSVLIISHDIEFLNQIINKIMYINKVTHKINVYEGNYHTYKKKYSDEQRLREKEIVQQEKEIKELEAFVQKARQASQTNHALKRMGQERELRLEKKLKTLKTREKPYKRVKMDIKPKREGGPMPVVVENLAFHYPGHPYLYTDLSFSINSKERFLVVGENGVGKSTLLKLLMGINTQDSGRIRFNPKTDIAYYSQELEQLDEEKTVMQNVETEGYTEWKLRGALSNFLFYEDDVNKKVSVLSPGEKARIALCKVLLQKANLLILDEPTNHLDPETQAIIGGNFALFEGTIIVVSHNAVFVEQIGISRMLILPSGRIDNYSKELLDYYYIVNTADEK